MPSVSEVGSAAAAAALFEEAARAGTSVSIGRDGGEVVVSTAGLARVLEHEAGDLTCTVEAGVRVRDLNDRLAGHGQMLALDPPGNPTIGACIAAGLSGPRSHRYGRPGDLLLGVTVVLADGTVAKAGGKVVKNVAGYDLGKLFCGSAGRLGLIVSASLRLHALPDAARSLAVPVSQADEALAHLHAVGRSHLVPSAVDLLWPGKLCLLFEGGRRGVDVQLAAAQELLGGEEADPWAEVLEFQAACAGRSRFVGLAGRQLVRGDLAYVPEACDEPWSPLAERVRQAFDPQGVLR